MSSFFILFFFIFSCQQSGKKKQEEINSEINHIENFSKPDFIVNHLELRKENTLNKFYSQNIQLQERLRASSVLVFSDNNKEKYLLVYQYEGDVKNSFSCFEIGYIKDDLKLGNDFTITKYDDFKTESGLKLGLSLNEIINLKGKDYKVEKTSKGEILRYIIDDPENSKLKQYNMPPYFMEFYLKDNKTYKIIFGFEYP